MKGGKKRIPDPTLINAPLIKGVVKSFIGSVSFKVDREARRVSIQVKGREYVLTYDQLVDELEAMLNDE